MKFSKFDKWILVFMVLFYIVFYFCFMYLIYKNGLPSRL